MALADAKKFIGMNHEEEIIPFVSLKFLPNMVRVFKDHNLISFNYVDIDDDLPRHVIKNKDYYLNKNLICQN